MTISLKTNKKLWILYSIALIIIFSIKYIYSISSSDELGWILAPTSRWVEILSGIPFKKMLNIGYVNHDYKFIIAPSCSGVTFMLITFSTLVFSFVKHMKTVKLSFYALTISLIFSYVFTIFINGFRIVLLIHSPFILQKTNLINLLSIEKFHTIVGTAIYFMSILIIYYYTNININKLLKPKNNSNDNIILQRDKSLIDSIRKFAPAIVCYFLITLGIPFLNKSFQGDYSQFISYCITVTVVCVFILFIVSIVNSLLLNIK